MAAKKEVKHGPLCHCFGIPALPDGVSPFDAAKHAVDVFAGNAPSDQRLATFASFAPGPITDDLAQAKITLLTSKWWGPKVDLSVKFLDTNNAELKAKILAFANMWNKYGDIQFRETASSTADIRISRGDGGYWAFLGTDMRLISTNQNNMNLQGFTLSTPDSEYSRVVCHEFGHVLGCPHEQSRPEVLARLDRQKTYQFYAQQYGWNKTTVDQQIFTPLDPNSVWATVPDETSIMCYQFPGQCTKNGIAIPGGFAINALDGSLIAEHYPKEGGGGGDGGNGGGGGGVWPPADTKEVKIGWEDYTPQAKKRLNAAGIAGINFQVFASSDLGDGTVGPAAETWVSDIADGTTRLLELAGQLVKRYGSQAKAVLDAARAFAESPGFGTAAALWDAVHKLTDAEGDDLEHQMTVVEGEHQKAFSAGNWVVWAKLVADLISSLLED